MNFIAWIVALLFSWLSASPPPSPAARELVQRSEIVAPVPVALAPVVTEIVAVGLPPVPETVGRVGTAAAPADRETPPPPEPEPTTTAPPPLLPDRTQVRIPDIGLTRDIVVGDQPQINACAGAILMADYGSELPVDGDWTYLAAHRTSCGGAGFGGIEILFPGTSVFVDVAGVGTWQYVVERTLIVDRRYPPDNWDSGDLIMQTTKGGDIVYLVQSRLVAS